MTREEFNQYAARFGDDFEAWPAPYRQEARYFAAARPAEDDLGDAALDRLVFEAVLMPTDETALTRGVLNRIAKPASSPAFRMPWLGWLSPLAMAASLAAVLMTASAAGYSLASSSGSALDSALMALATGEEAFGTGLFPIGDHLDAEDSL